MLAPARLAMALAMLMGAASASYYVNSYTGDHENEAECEFGAPQTQLALYVLNENTCHRVLKPSIATDKYVRVSVPSGDDNSSLKFDDFCDQNCATCTFEYNDLTEAECFRTSEGSATIQNTFCAGSPNLQVRGGLSIFLYDSGSCASTDMKSGDVLVIRNYQKQSTDGCVEDYYIGNEQRFYDINITEMNGTRYYSGVIGCSEDTCSDRSCTYVVDKPQPEGSCFVTPGGKAITFADTSALSDCNGGRPGPPPSPPAGSTITPGEFGDDANDPELIGGVVGGGVAVALAIFGIALAYRRYEFRQRQALNVHYTTVKNNYGTASYDEEGMTTDI